MYSSFPINHRLQKNLFIYANAVLKPLSPYPVHKTSLEPGSGPMRSHAQIAMKSPVIQMKVATLNFTGINNSPFEYHDGSEEKIILDRIFLANLRKLVPGFREQSFCWQVSRIDTVIQKQRYSVSYRKDVGIVRGKLVNEVEFNTLWSYDFDRALENADFRGAKIEESHIDNCRLFDFIMYQTILERVYGSDFNWENVKQLDCSRFRQYLMGWHFMPYLNTQAKMLKVKEYFVKNDLNVLFLQESQTEAWETVFPPETYAYKRRACSVIIYKPREIGAYNDPHFDLLFGQKLNFNNDSAYLLSNSNNLLISAHLTSKSHNVEQAAAMFATLDSIIKAYPNIKIILGTDANHPLKCPSNNFRMYPKNQDACTTRKKRTYMQMQFNKSEKMVTELKDFLITNTSLNDGSIEGIEGDQITDESLLPNGSHPFDHYCVRAVVAQDFILDTKLKGLFNEVEQIRKSRRHMTTDK